jgi:hypothetical protein
MAMMVGLLVAAPRVVGTDEAFRPLFNGKDLAGWVNVNTHESTWQVRDGMIVCSGKPIGELRTERQYENFILELEWRHMQAGGNAGAFVWADDLPARGVPFIRGIEVQILDGRNTENYTSHGDVFAIHGATLKPDRPHPAGWSRCLPSERRCKPAGQWNHYRVTCNDGTLKLAVNGKVVSGGSQCSPRKGYICLESEGSEAHFRNIRIQELPSSNPPAETVATVERGFRPLYRGVDLAGWKVEPGHGEHWVARDWTLCYDGKSAAVDKTFWTKDAYGEFELIVDWRWETEPSRRAMPVSLGGQQLLSDEVEAKAKTWHRAEITRTAGGLSVVLDGKTLAPQRPHAVHALPTAIGLAHQGVPVEFANIFIRPLGN